MSNYYRYKAIEEKGAECENCGETSDLEVHHRDRIRCNNELSNLIVLCSECHNTVHHGWPEGGSFLMQLKIDTGVRLPEPVYKEAISQSEVKDVTPGVIIKEWADKAEKFDELEARR